MKNKNSYLPLIAAWENYLEITKKADIKDFAFWLLKNENIEIEKNEKPLDAYFETNTQAHNYAYKSSEAAFLLWRLGKFIRYYTKPVLLENGLAGQDDFAILSHIDYKKSCSKREAIDANIIDPTTGIEIIKRLIKQGLVSEKLNKDDKRQRIISLTKPGKEKLYSIYTGFSKVQDVMAEMNVEQRELLIQTLKDLDLFHTKNVDALSNSQKK
jgi:DNA-binding MarR family transcriptional regulator